MHLRDRLGGFVGAAEAHEAEALALATRLPHGADRGDVPEGFEELTQGVVVRLLVLHIPFLHLYNMIYEEYIK